MDAINTAEPVQAEKRVQQKTDFKMVTFSLGGKDYGIDIMKVKEISKVDKYTFVPNTYPFVLGVHNLRGDIISIVDMRKMFGLPIEKKEELLNVIIINVAEFQLGIVVDAINKVIGIARESVQPPPPLFSDINIRYLSGVVEYGGNLYLILDVDKIFYEEEKSYESQVRDALPKFEAEAAVDDAMHEFHFIVETLATFRKFYVTETNRHWVENRFKEWKAGKAAQGLDFQLKSENEADEFLTPFYSACTGRLWDEKLKNTLATLLPDRMDGTINIWNTGCGRGHEAYTIGLVFRQKYPREILKVWANDIDLLSVSTAPNLVFKEIELPEYVRKSDFFEPSDNGYRCKKELKERIYFEYHDTLHPSTMPDIDLIVARDVLSFQTPANQVKMLAEFHSKLKVGAPLVIGDNEGIAEPGWSKSNVAGMNVYIKEQVK